MIHPLDMNTNGAEIDSLLPPNQALTLDAPMASLFHIVSRCRRAAQRHVSRCMYTPTCNSSICRAYFKLVGRWPVIHLLICCGGIAAGIGGLLAFGDTTGNQRQVLASRVVGLFMLVVYGWILVALIARLLRGSWRRHCEARIVQCSSQPAPSPNDGPE